MDLEIQDVAELLNVSQTTVEDWLTEGKIPAYQLNQQYRFSKMEIEQWMMEQGGAAPRTVAVQEKEHSSKRSEVPHWGSQQFALYRALGRGGIHSSRAKTKEEAIRGAMQWIAPEVRLDPDLTAELLIDRERLMPTALNNRVAVPHSRECLQQIPLDLVSIVVLEEPIDYGALDGQPVDILFFLFAAEDKMHLHLLSKLAHLTRSSEALALLRTLPGKSELLNFIRGWESALRA